MATKNKAMAFTTKQKGHLHSAINALAQVQFSRARTPVSIGTLRTLFVPAEMREVLTHAYRVAAPLGTVFDLWVQHFVPAERGSKPVTFKFRWDFAREKEGFFVPHGYGNRATQPATTLQLDAPEPMVEGFWLHLSRLCDISYRFGMVRHVLDSLDGTNTTPAQVQFVWPAIVPLLRKAGHGTLAAEIETPKPRAGDSARVAPEISEYIKPANDMVARAMLIEEEARAPSGGVQYWFDDPPRFNHFDGLTWTL